MDHLSFSAILFVSSLFAGLFGALSGLGGGIVIVPLLVLGFNVNTQYAIGASLIGVIATSSGSSITFLPKRYANMRLGMFLETATASGAILGAYFASVAAENLLQILFGIVLLYSVFAARKSQKNTEEVDMSHDRLSDKLKLDSSYPVDGSWQQYRVHRIPLGWLLMFIAGNLSGMLGIGSGALKVLAMERAMKVPFRVSTTTSNFMIGVTAAASAGTLFHLGYISPPVVMPLIPGVLIGSYAGSKILMRAKLSYLQLIFSIMISLIGIQMIYQGVT